MLPRLTPSAKEKHTRLFWSISTFVKVASAVAIFVFIGIIFLMTNKLQSQQLSFREIPTSSQKNIKLANRFPHEVSVYFDDGETGSFLTNLVPEDYTWISVMNGQGLFATEPDGWERIAYVTVREDIDEYEFAPPNEPISRPNVSISLYHAKRNEVNSLVRPYGRHRTTAMAAKFRS